MPPVLELRGITKAFPGVLANDHIDLTLNRGEILALLGENGAGKTTLMNILYGLYTPDAGEIVVRGQKVTIHNPSDAIRLGIGMVHQHFMLIPVFTVTENVMLGIEPVKAGMILNREAASIRIREISERFGLQVDPDALVENLPVGVQQRVEIIKVLYRAADILILDEPTAVLTPQEVEELFKIVRSLAAQGTSVIFITHKLKEVLAIADRIVVLRNGRVVGETLPAAADETLLARMMVGREVILRVDKRPSQPGEPVLDVRELHVTDQHGVAAVRGLSLQVRAGEVVGIAGVQGNGQTQLVEALTGLRRIERGYVTILGHDTTWATPREITELGVAHVPEDRQQDGLVLSFPVSYNLILNTYYVPPFARYLLPPRKGLRRLLTAVGCVLGGIAAALIAVNIERATGLSFQSFLGGILCIFAGSLVGAVLGYFVATLAFLQEREIERVAQERVEAFDVRTPGTDTVTSSLSGGNQQKVIVAREFSRPVRLLIAAQPTRGLDVGSIEYIHRRIVEKRDSGCAVLLVSTELDEILGVSDRIAVMYRGQLLATFPAAEATRERVGLLMAGVHEQEVTRPSDVIMIEP